MTKLFVLEQTGFGVIAFSENFDKVKEYYDEETCNDKYAGFRIKEVECKVDLNKIGEISLYTYLTLLAKNV